MIPRLHAVTADRILERPDFLRVAQEVLRVGGSRVALHVRGPDASGARIYEVARSLLPAARASGAVLFANDRVDVSLALGLPGVHLGARSLPPAAARKVLDREALVGVSVHGTDEAREAEAGGADYLFVGTIFPSPSHPERSPAGVGRVREVTGATRLPGVAIGGVDPEDVASILDAGGHGVAAVSGIWDASDPPRAARSYLEAVASSV